MPDPIYFQWQNEFLLRTIYPLRETKLRDFLQYFFEIEIWQQYKNMPAPTLASDIQSFRGMQKSKVLDAYDLFQKLAAYFLDEDVSDQYRASFPNPDPEIMLKINDIHKLFKTYYPTYQNPVKEKYFTSERARQLEDLRGRLQTQINDKTRILRNILPASPLKATYENDLSRLSNVCIKMVDQELSRLYDFLRAYARLEVYKQEALKRKAVNEKARSDGAVKLSALKLEIDALESRLVPLVQAGRRLSTAPDMPGNKTYFLDEDVSDVYQAKIAGIDPGIMLKINELHKNFKKWFPGYQNPLLEKNFLAQRIKEFEDLRKLRAQELADKQRALQWIQSGTSNWDIYTKVIDLLKNNILRALDEELNRLYDLQWAYAASEKTPAVISTLIAQNQKDRSDVETQLKGKKDSAAAQEAEQNRLGQELARNEKEIMLALVDALPVSLPDIVRSKTEAYKAELAQKDIDQLMEAVVQRFITQPERYPLWLQYMVVHFSGMRYQSAHGSWADPKDLLLSLRIKAVQDELKRQGEDAINALCDQRYLCYQSVQTAVKVLGTASDAETQPPALALTSDMDWKTKVVFHLKALDPTNSYNRKKALLDLRIDEEDYDIEHMTSQQALDALEGMKDQLPDWMWKEIVKVTDLKLKEVRDANWEQTTPDDLSERYTREMEPYRVMLENWKRANLTGWREEHDRTSQLIVTRAVCNEVAEHIQHLRGLSPTGGLTAKPEWYMRKEKEPQWAGAADKAYFVKGKSAADFKAGASILWLQWVNSEPNAWQIARPIVLKTGEELLPPINDGVTRITNTGNSFLRDATYKVKDASGATLDQTVHQWLRWLHEATVVEVTETVDGPTIFTFETARPNDDKRQSSIGMFKHDTASLLYNVTSTSTTATFVGYVPESNVPYSDLQDMLDWNHILLRPAYPPDQIAQYWKKVTRPPQAVSFDLGAFGEEVPVEIAPQLASPFLGDSATCYELNPATGSLAQYQPQVLLKRGAQLRISKGESQSDGTQPFYLVTACKDDPRAEGLYIRAAEVLDLPENSASQALRAKADIPLFRICALDEKGRPLFEETGAVLGLGTKLLASMVQKAGADDLGNGVIHSQGHQAYYLVTTCPRQSSAEGLFVRKNDARKISQRLFALTSTTL
jgi:hypothetical protein